MKMLSRTFVVASMLMSFALEGAGAQHLDAVFAISFDDLDRNRVCFGDGAGGFTCADVSLDTNFSLDVALGDINGDTNLDAVFANGIDVSQANRVCLGDGTGGFACSDISMDANQTAAVALGDVNGDTNLDAVFASGYRIGEPNRVCLGDGTGGFTCSDISADTNSTLSLALGDVNGDTNLDAVFANGSGETNRVCLGDGMGNFDCSDVSPEIPTSQGVALGDVDGDANLDAIFANRKSFNQPNRVCFGDGTGAFTCSDIGVNPSDSSAVALGDVNGDANLDAVFANGLFNREPNSVCLGDGTGGFTCSDINTDTNFTFDVALGDVNGDTYLDAVFSNLGQANRVCIGDGDGGFSTCSDIGTDINSATGVALGVLTVLPTVEVPALTTWGLLSFTALLVLAGFRRLRLRES